MGQVILLSLLLVMLTFLFHYKVLLSLSVYSARINLANQSRVLLIVLVLFFAHIVEIGCYALAYAWSVEGLELGALKGLNRQDPMDYLYFSTAIYTSLGLGDVYPAGHIRFLTGIEALNGLFLIAWSASFTFLVMSRLWPWSDCCDRTDNDKDEGNDRL